MSIEAIKELRARTHLGMTECKSALSEANGDIEKAVEILQKKNLRLKPEALLTAVEGEVYAEVFGKHARIVEVNSQTDFAARSDQFKEFVRQLIVSSPVDQDLTEVEFAKNNLQKVSKVLGEQLVIRRNKTLSTQGMLQAYNHLGGKIAVLVSLQCSDSNASDPILLQCAENLAMHIAAVNPMVINRQDISKDIVEKQRNLFMSQLSEDPKPKPPAVLSKILEGKMNKWYSEVVLLDQDSVVEEGVVGKLLEKICKDLNDQILILDFIRYERGEMV